MMGGHLRPADGLACVASHAISSFIHFRRGEIILWPLFVFCVDSCHHQGGILACIGVFVYLYMTASQYKGKYLSGPSQKIARSAGCKKIFFPLYHQKDEIHSFPAMYNTWGSSLGRMGQKHDFLKKNALKTAFLGDTILDRLTSEGVGTHFF